MSTSLPPASAGAGIPAPAVMRGPDEIRLYGHSSLFYWWPIWLLGFIMTLLSLFENTRVVHVPGHTELSATTQETSRDGKEFEERTYHLKNSEAFSNEKGKDRREFLQRYVAGKDDRREPPRVSKQAWMGATFCVVLLLVIGITNVPLRGLWSIVIIVTVIMMVVIFALLDWWDAIFHAIGGLHIYIGMAGYLFIATVLFIMWVVAMFVFDRQIYISFEPGQMKVVEEVGGGEKSYDTAGMSIEKHRDDLFRHWVLGLGSGDLTVRTSGATPHQVNLTNVLFISKKLQQIEMMQREKQIRVEG